MRVYSRCSSSDSESHSGTNDTCCFQVATSDAGRPAPPVVRRWTGVYSQALDDAACWRRQVQPGVWIVTGPGGRGMTLAPAIAEDTWEVIG